MDPISMGLQIAGLGMSLFGGIMGFGESKKQAAIQQQIAQQEALANEQRRKAMELNARRQQLQNLRNTQLQRSMALTTGTAQGAQFGSGVVAGMGNVQSQGNFNALGISQNLEIGRNLFDINDRESYLKSQLSASQSQSAMWQGFGNLGGSLMKAGPTIGGLAKDAFAGMNFGPSTYGMSQDDIFNRQIFPGYGTNR